MWRLGNSGYNLAKPRTFAQKFSFAKLSENVVEIKQYVILASGKIVENMVKYIINFGLIRRKGMSKKKR